MKMVWPGIGMMPVIWISIILSSLLAAGNNEPVLIDETQAIDRALQYTGFDKAEGFEKSSNISVDKIDPASVDIPFWKNPSKSISIWKVQFLHVPIGEGRIKTIERNFEVFIDGDSGKLLRIYSICDSVGSSDTLPQPSAVQSEDFFRRCRYNIGPIPDSIPTIDLLDALNSIRVASPTATKLIDAYFWNLTYAGGTIERSWLIMSRGIEDPIPASHDVHDWEINSMMSCIDAMTGQPIFATNAPSDPQDIKRRRQEEK